MPLVFYPPYYKKKLGNLAVSCYDVIELITQDVTDPLEAFCIGNVIKYLWRYKLKNGIEDLKKAQTYLSEIIDRMERGIQCKNPIEDGTTHTDYAST